ncbi:hypothetical protein ACP4OV_022103 [Aristida adscensionis]
MLAVVFSSVLIIASFPSSTIATDPLFTDTFDVSYGDNYQALISGLRNKLGDPKHFSHNRPVLPPVGAPGSPRPLFHVELNVPGGALTLATRADNLCLEGFRSRDGMWWELAPDAIPNATYVGFSGAYGGLLGNADKMVDVALGPEHMTAAVHTLAARTKAHLANGTAQEQAKQAVAALQLMVHEATKLTTVSDLVAELMHPKPETENGTNMLHPKAETDNCANHNTITAEMKAQVNGWAELSGAVLKTDACPTERFTPFKEMGVTTVEQAVKTLGILLFVKV